MSDQNSFVAEILNYFKLVSIPVVALCIFNFIVLPIYNSFYINKNEEKNVIVKKKSSSNSNSIANTLEDSGKQKKDSVKVRTNKREKKQTGVLESNESEPKTELSEVITVEKNEKGFKEWLNIPGGNFETPRSFFSGLWHGLIIYFTLISSAFFENGIYTLFNTGLSYWLGFGIGVFIFFIMISIKAN